jgi:uncharacterized Zn-finger protein
MHSVQYVGQIGLFAVLQSLSRGGVSWCVIGWYAVAWNDRVKWTLSCMQEKPYMCEHCNACFADRGTWRNHVRIHTGERPYTCALCDKTFAQRTNLQAHINTHTDERPFPCQVHYV